MFTIIKKFLGFKKLPSYKEIYNRSGKYAKEECSLNNFNDGDEILIARVLARDKTSLEEVQNKINNQWSQEKKMMLSNFVINNNGVDSL